MPHCIFPTYFGKQRYNTFHETVPRPRKTPSPPPEPKEGFHLLMLPDVARMECLLLMTPVEMLEFSLCTKKTNRTVREISKTYMRTCKVEIILYEADCYLKFIRGMVTYHVLVQQDPSVSFMDMAQSLKYQTSKEKRTILGTQFWGAYHKKNRGMLTTSWENQIEGVGVLMEHIFRTFQVKTMLDLQFNICDLSTRSGLLRDLIVRNPNKIRKIQISSENQNREELLLYALSNFRNQTALIFNLKFHAHYKIKCITFNSDMLLQFKHGNFVTVDDLEHWNCRYLHVFESSLQASDIKNWLKKWKSGSGKNSNLNTMLVELKGGFFMKDVLEGFEFEKDERIWKHSMLGEIHICYNILRDNQIQMATVFEKVVNSKKCIVITIF